MRLPLIARFVSVGGGAGFRDLRVLGSLHRRYMVTYASITFESKKCDAWKNCMHSLERNKPNQLVCHIFSGPMHDHIFSYFLLAIQLTIIAGKYTAYKIN